MSQVLIAVPSESPGGVNAKVGVHFGHCEMYTLVRIEDKAVLDVSVIPNVAHEQGGCMAPVKYLSEKGVNCMIAGGMGMRPLMGFAQEGIDVFHSGNAPTVGMALDAFMDQKLIQFGKQHTCGGENGGGCGHDH